MLNTKIDPFSLPHLPLTDLKQLPACPAVYFALTGEEILYVGQTTNLQQRWTTHHRWQQLATVEGEIRIAWLECSDASLLIEIEKALIEHFSPSLNGSPLPVGGKTKLDMIGIYVQPSLKKDLERWAEEERRSVSNLAAILLEEAVKKRKDQLEESVMTDESTLPGQTESPTE